MGNYGKGADCQFLEPTAISGTDPIVSHPLNAMQDYDIVGVQLIVESEVDNFLVTDTDNVVASTKTFTFANGGFTTDMVGGTLTIQGSVADDAVYTIASRTSATVIVVTETVAADETFDPDTVTAFVTFPNTADGDWKIEISNDVTPAGMAGSYDQDSNVEGHWTDITAQFSPSIQAVDHTDASTLSQYVQATICVRAMRFTFTPSAGDGFASVLGLARSYS